jgi:acyl-CoA synthetase (AMP-forming)/AMP-acid ligase II
LRLCFPQEITGEDQGVEAPSLIDIDEAMIIYTSGTAGLPKGVVLTHLNLMTSTRSVVEYLRLSADDTGLICLPLFHIYTLSQLLTHLLCGGTVVLVENFLFPTQVLRFIERERVTGFGGSPGAFHLLLNVKGLASYQLASLRYLLNSGGPLPQQTLLQLMETFPRAEIISAYGLTEASSRVSHCTYKKGSGRRLGSVGRPISNVEVRVVDAKGADVRPGELGEIVIRGSTVMKGYFKDAAATARALKSDGLHTGDFAILDEERNMFIVGRRDDIVNSGGESISVKEVEEVLLSHWAIAEAAVVGKPDEVLGEALQAFIVPRPELTVAVDAVKEHCLTHLARYKVPRDFVICNALPKTPSGKVQKRLLREHLIEEASKRFA